MKTVHLKKLEAHQQEARLLSENLFLFEEKPRIKAFLEAYIQQVEDVGKLYRTLRYFRKRGMREKMGVREKLARLIFEDVVPFLSEVAFEEGNDDLLAKIRIGPKAFEYLYDGELIKRLEQYIQLCEEYLPRYGSSSFNRGHLDLFIETCWAYRSVVMLPLRERNQLKERNQQFVQKIQNLNACWQKMDMLFLRQKKDNPRFYTSYLSAKHVTSKRTKRFHVLGQVVDHRTHMPVAGAKVSFKGCDKTCTTSKEGRLWFKEFPLGSYEMKITHQDYHPHRSFFHLLNETRNQRFVKELEPLEEE
ncbi:MAG: hypothetical protein ACEPOZ_19620 [Marinifilaceae bacterium]